MFDDLIKEKTKNTVKNICCVCGKIVMSWFHGHGVTCSTECEKKLDESDGEYPDTNIPNHAECSNCAHDCSERTDIQCDCCTNIDIHICPEWKDEKCLMI